MDYVVPHQKSPTLADLNAKAIQKLYELIESLDEHSDPDMILACAKGVSQLNSSVKNSDIIPQSETSEERQQREAASILEAEING